MIRRPARTDAVLLTGITGFVGAAVLARLLDRTDRPVVALVRAGSPAEASARVRETLHALYADPDVVAEHAARCVAVPADLLREDLGLDEATSGALARACDEVIHCAASVSFTLPVAQARAINVAGAARLAELAERAMARGAGLRRFVHVSTAYVAGERTGTFGEDDVSQPRAYRNTYEQTKHEAEALLRAWAPDLPLQIVRPSIVVGDRADGWTRSFNVMYWPLRQFAEGRLPVIPALADAPVDVVSVDYVADAILALSDAADGTYHLVAGEHASTVADVIAMAARRFEREAPAIVRPAVLHEALASRHALRPGQRRALDRARVYFPYFALGVRFDDHWTRQALAPHGVVASPLEDYFDTLMDYAEHAAWGRPAELQAA